MNAEPTKVAVHINVSSEVARDAMPNLSPLWASMAAAMDRQANPWKAADPNPMPRFDWWPQIDRAIFWRSEIPCRVRGAIDVLRYGVTDDGSDW